MKGWEAVQVVCARSETAFWQYPKRIPARYGPGTIVGSEGYFKGLGSAEGLSIDSRHGARKWISL